MQITKEFLEQFGAIEMPDNRWFLQTYDPCVTFVFRCSSHASGNVWTGYVGYDTHRSQEFRIGSFADAFDLFYREGLRLGRWNLQKELRNLIGARQE